MSELRDVIASVLAENARKPARVQANLVMQVIEGGKPRRAKPAVVAAPTECRCAEWAALAVDDKADKSIQAQTIDAVEAEGRLKQFTAWLLDKYVNAYSGVGRRTG